MRVTQRSMYNSMVGEMQSTLSAYMESVTQGGSQKRLNRPSDDPAGAARVLGYRASLTQTNQHVTNASTASGWLEMAESSILGAQTVLNKIRTLAEQGATGSYDADQRMAMAKEVREHLGSLMNMANNKYEGKYVFSGEKTGTAPYQEGLSTTVHRSGPAGVPDMTVSGTLNRTAMVRFGSSGAVPPAVGAAPMEYMWSDDGGKTWTQGTIAAQLPPPVPPAVQPNTVISVGTSQITIPAGQSLDAVQGYTPVPGGLPDDPMEMSAGTTVDVRPTMIYQGSDNNGSPTVTPYGPPLPPGAKTVASGKFANDTLVRFDSATPTAGNDFTFSYSTDAGRTWVTGNKATMTASPPPATNLMGARLVLPGGFVDVEIPDPSTIPQDAQLSIKPQRTSLDFEILENQSVSVNNIGKDIFGGLYTPKGSNQLQAAKGKENDNNMFETVGRLIAALETNDQTAVGKCLDEINDSEKNVLYHSADIGGKMNRISTTLDVLEDLKINQRSRLSAIEDIDFTELMTNLSQQQTAYQTVLKSSSMIMQLNLMKFM